MSFDCSKVFYTKHAFSLAKKLKKHFPIEGKRYFSAADQSCRNKKDVHNAQQPFNNQLQKEQPMAVTKRKKATPKKKATTRK
ncbi:MAG: hypothetical protein ACE5FH_11900, partial [Candidatus Zixiibacteriota bacterium]